MNSSRKPSLNKAQVFRRDVRSGGAETVVVRLDRLELSAALTAVLAPVRSVLLQLTAMLRDLDAGHCHGEGPRAAEPEGHGQVNGDQGASGTLSRRRTGQTAATAFHVANARERRRR